MKILIVVSNLEQVLMFKHIADELADCEILMLNINRFYSKSVIEHLLKTLDFSYETLVTSNTRKIKKILLNRQVNVVVVGHDAGIIENLIIQCANVLKIPTLLVQDGILIAGRNSDELKYISKPSKLKFYTSKPSKILHFIMNKKYSWEKKLEIISFELLSRTRGKNGIYGHGQCLKIAVFGNSVKKMLVAEGISPHRIIITGNPKFDILYHHKNTDYKQVMYQKLNIDSNKEIILLLTQPFVELGLWTPEQKRQFVLGITNAISALPNAQLVIKLRHPSENVNSYHGIINGIPQTPIFCETIPLYQLLNACSIALTVSSTAALEAMVMGKPVVIINLFNDSGSSFYIDSGAPFVEKMDELIPTMRKALYDAPIKEDFSKSANKFVYEQAYLQDGQASYRIACLIRNMCNKRLSQVSN